jgi:hypothetical protein
MIGVPTVYGEDANAENDNEVVSVKPLRSWVDAKTDVFYSQFTFACSLDLLTIIRSATSVFGAHPYV